MAGPFNVTSSSLPLQLMISFHWRIFMPFFFLATLFLFTFKSLRYYYPGYLLGWEITPVFLYVFVESTRLLMLSRGNKMNRIASHAYSIGWSIPIITLHSYYIDLQTYITRVDVVLNALGLALVGLEVLTSAWTIFASNMSARMN